VPDSLDKAKAAGPGGGGGRRPSTVRPAENRLASAFFIKSGRDMLSLSISVDDPKRTLVYRSNFNISEDSMPAFFGRRAQDCPPQKPW
jgi:hypothetical protein